MTKTEAKTNGTAAGVAYANTIADDVLRADLDASRQCIANTAANLAITAGFRTVDSPNAAVFIEAFKHAAGLRFYGRRNELPDVQQANRLTWTNRYLTRTADDAKATLDKFRARLDEGNDHAPCYAFEWGDDAMQAAARLDVLARLADVFKSETVNEDVDKLLDIARREAMRGAQNPSRSTSQPSNLMHQYKVQAYAEFVAECGVRF